jgi:DNA (cytosine-5)-methyltransferase 1
MSELGYKNYYQVLDAKDYGIPQHRERVFTVSIRNDIEKGFIFPEKEELKLRLKDMLEEKVDEKYYLSDKMLNYIVSEDDKYKVNKELLVVNRDIACSKTTREGNTRADTSDYVAKPYENTIDIKQVGLLDIKGQDCIKRVYSDDGLSPTLTDMQGGLRQPKILIKNNTQQGYLEAYEGDGVYTNVSTKRGTVQPQMIHTLTSIQDAGVVVSDEMVKENDVIRHSYSQSRIDDWQHRGTETHNISPTLDTRSDCLGVTTKENDKLRIRKLTPKECWRLMGFKDEEFEKAEKVNSNAQLYKQAGNSIVVNVLEKILRNLL